ncbi:MAG: cell division protein FtsZ [Betaproteobacteria bacterium]|nr:cell division protein FtsZ [Betaproteobacteria bacterium]
MTLTQGLLALAAAVLVVLVAQGVWASWRARPRRAAHTLDRVEPSLSSGAAVVDGVVSGTPSDPVPSGGQATAAPAGAVASDRGVRGVWSRRRAAIDPLIDAIAEISPEAPLPAEPVLAALPASRRVGSKLLLVEGLNAETGVWEAPQHGQRYSAFQAGVQLANRSGPLNEIGYSEFVQKVQTFADALGAAVDFVDMSEAVSRARELDEFAHAHDAQLAVHLRARGPSWTVGYLQQCAARHGMAPGAIAGQWVLPSEEPDSPPLVLLTFDAQAALAEDLDQSALRECTLSLDVPQTPEAVEPFSHWQRLASALAQDLDGALVDDDGRPVSIQQFAGIHQELQRLYEALAARDLPAGSIAAQRLFS